MANKEKFEEPGKKAYSVKIMLTEERIQEAIRGLIDIQKNLRETLEDGPYKKAEGIFDTAIASLMAHGLAIDIREVHRREE